MSKGYVIEIGNSFIRVSDLKTATITKEFSRALIFTNKSSALEVANRFGGKVLKIELELVKEETE